MPFPYDTIPSYKDRTREFRDIVDRCKKQAGPLAPALLAQPSTQIQKKADFARRAARIGESIHGTSVKLQRLSVLARRTSAFDDPAEEIDLLTNAVKKDVNDINSQISELEQHSLKTREDNRHSQTHTHTVLDNLRLRLKDTTREFKSVLTIRADNINHNKERRKLFSSGADEDTDLLQRYKPNLSNGGPTTPSFITDGQQALLTRSVDPMLESRAEALKNVESTIVELGTIFNRLSELVVEQGELAIRIDENVEESLSNMTGAQKHLVKYLNTLNSNKWLAMKVLFTLLLFVVLFIVFLA